MFIDCSPRITPKRQQPSVSQPVPQMVVNAVLMGSGGRILLWMLPKRKYHFENVLPLRRADEPASAQTMKSQEYVQYVHIGICNGIGYDFFHLKKSREWLCGKFREKKNKIYTSKNIERMMLKKL